jgi:hypothetical protein
MAVMVEGAYGAAAAVPGKGMYHDLRSRSARLPIWLFYLVNTVPRTYSASSEASHA